MKKRSFVLSALGLFAAAAIGFTIGSNFFHFGYDVDPDLDSKIDGLVVDAQIEAKAVLPGSTFDLSQTITNNSTDYMYIFVRIDNDKDLYTLTELSDGWTVVKSEDGQVIAAYGSDSEMTPVEIDETVTITGTITLDVTNKEFSQLSKEDVKFGVHDCGILISQTENTTPMAVYGDYESLGGL